MFVSPNSVITILCYNPKVFVCQTLKNVVCDSMKFSYLPLPSLMRMAVAQNCRDIDNSYILTRVRVLPKPIPNALASPYRTSSRVYTANYERCFVSQLFKIQTLAKSESQASLKDQPKTEPPVLMLIFTLSSSLFFYRAKVRSAQQLISNEKLFLKIHISEAYVCTRPLPGSKVLQKYR
jgi:hypothetical protein